MKLLQRSRSWCYSKKVIHRREQPSPTRSPCAVCQSADVAEKRVREREMRCIRRNRFCASASNRASNVTTASLLRRCSVNQSRWRAVLGADKQTRPDLTVHVRRLGVIASSVDALRLNRIRPVESLRWFEQFIIIFRRISPKFPCPEIDIYTSHVVTVRLFSLNAAAGCTISCVRYDRWRSLTLSTAYVEFFICVGLSNHRYRLRWSLLQSVSCECRYGESACYLANQKHKQWGAVLISLHFNPVYVDTVWKHLKITIIIP